METNTKPLTTTSSARPYRLPNARIVQNFHLVWLDKSIDEINDDYSRDSILQLQQIVKTINIFTDVDECIDFITDIKDEAFMVISEKFSQTIISIIQDIPKVRCIYILSDNNVQYQRSINKEMVKVSGVYTEISSICEPLKRATQVCDHNSISISFIKKTERIVNQSIDTLDVSFMYTQILKEILLTIDFEQIHFNDFITYCRELFVSNATELKNIEKIEKEYRLHKPIWWYTYQYFLYSMVNRALRLMEVDLITRMGFFVRDLHQHIAALHSEQYSRCHHSNTFIVYRGQGLSQTDFDQLKMTQGGLISFNTFLSTSLDREVSLAFADSNQYDPDLVGVLFEMKIDPVISTTHFANVKNISYFQGEEEILFSMHSVFRIGHVEQIDKNNNRLWQVKLTLTGDNDPQLQELTQSMRNATRGPTGWFRLGRLMMTVAQYDKAQQVFEMILDHTTDDKEIDAIYYYLGWIKYDQEKSTEAITYLEKSLKIREKTLPANHPLFDSSYNSIGCVYNKMGEYSKALSYFEKALEIEQKTLAENHPDLAISYNNIGLVYRNMGEYSKALSYYEKDLEICKKILPAKHPHLAISYNNIGLVCDTMGEHSKALSNYEKALEIRQKALPADHPDFAESYHNIGGVYDDMSDYSKALSYYEKAVEIYQKMLTDNHPNLAASYNNIGLVYEKMGEYLKAFSYFQKALEIRQKSLRMNHPDFAQSYNNIGRVYDNVGEYPKALSYYETAVEILQKTIPRNHPDLASSYNNIGLVYDNMGEYSKALSNYEKALDIHQNTLPTNHPLLGTYYNNIGSVYSSMGEYSKALSYYEKSLEIRQKTVAANHPDLANSLNNIGGVYYNMGEYSKALSYLEHALNIVQQSLPHGHPHLRSMKESIEVVKKKCK